MIIETNVPAFDAEIVKQSGFIRAKYHTWPEPRNGLVTFVQRDRMTCLFQKGANAAVSYFVVKAAEVVDGKWEITYSNDMEEIYHVGTD